MSKQVCVECDVYTGRCKEDQMKVGDDGPYCEDCFEVALRKAEIARLQTELAACRKEPCHECLAVALDLNRAREGCFRMVHAERQWLGDIIEARVNTESALADAVRERDEVVKLLISSHRFACERDNCKLAGDKWHDAAFAAYDAARAGREEGEGG